MILSLKFIQWISERMKYTRRLFDLECWTITFHQNAAGVKKTHIQLTLKRDQKLDVYRLGFLATERNSLLLPISLPSKVFLWTTQDEWIFFSSTSFIHNRFDSYKENARLSVWLSDVYANCFWLPNSFRISCEGYSWILIRFCTLSLARTVPIYIYSKSTNLAEENHLIFFGQKFAALKICPIGKNNGRSL